MKQYEIVAAHVTGVKGLPFYEGQIVNEDRFIGKDLAWLISTGAIVEKVDTGDVPAGEETEDNTETDNV